MLTVSMSPQEQLFIELVNRARADPAAEVLRNPNVFDINQDVAEDRLISLEPKQPLAPHQALTDAMIGHVNDLLARDYFAHESPEGGTPSSRAMDAGYPIGAGENIAWSGNTGGIDRAEEVYLRHAGLIESVGHRVNMMSTTWREIGAGIRYGIFTREGSNFQSIMAGTLFGNRGGDSFITGVAITDFISANNFYDVGEGIGNATITVVNVQTSEVQTVQTGGSGGYSIQLPNGIYDVTATGNNISRPLTVRGVLVDDANVKVDFNSRLMNTRFVQGRFYEDKNGNGQRDAGDEVIAGLSAFVDLNRNGTFDDGEPTDTTDSTGLFQIDGLLPNEYVVDAIIPNGWQSSGQGAYVVNTSSRSVIGIDFALQKLDSLPNASNDQATGLTGEDIEIDVLENDSDADGELNPNSIRIVSLPQNGQVSVLGNSIVYKSTEGFSGRDSFSYSVEDQAGQRSNVASVSVEVKSDKPWQNPTTSADVDGDGFVAPRDVLILVIEINNVGAHSLLGRERQPNSPYLDVSGDNFLSPKDVLIIVTLLNSRASSEPPLPATVSGTDAFFSILALDDDDDHRNLLHATTSDIARKALDS